MAKHERYPNPPILEALCEVHFRLSAEHPWSPRVPGALWREIADEYPDLEPLTEMGMEFIPGPTGVTQNIFERKRFRFTHKSKTRLVQLAESFVSINVLPPYPG